MQRFNFSLLARSIRFLPGRLDYFGCSLPSVDFPRSASRALSTTSVIAMLATVATVATVAIALPMTAALAQSRMVNDHDADNAMVDVHDSVTIGDSHAAIAATPIVSTPMQTGTVASKVSVPAFSAYAIAPPAITTSMTIAPVSTGAIGAVPSVIGTAQNQAPLGESVTGVSAEAPPTDLWDRIRAGYSMEDLNDPLVAKWEKFYVERPEYMARIVDRSSKYMFYIVTELERRGMPLEIALLPMIESAFNPGAYSTAKAAGIWQFIPSTGVNYGMKQDWWADSRRDIVAATNGALDYLAKLHGMFGDWQLALASYNWGEGSVGRAVQKAKLRGKDGSYLSLDMPNETRNYLPKLQAVKNIIRDPAAFGLTIASISNEPYFKTITLANPIDLKRAAQLAEMNEADFVALNPAHNRPVIGGRSEYQILLPADKADSFLAKLEANEKPRVSWMAYRTRQGDRIEVLAERFGTTAAALKSVNGIRSPSSVLPAGYHLLVPSDGPSVDALGSIQNAVFTKFPEYIRPRTHKVRKGETFAGIAKRYDVIPGTLAQWNRMSKQSVRTGQLLYVNGPAPVRRVANKGGRTVQVKRGHGKQVRHSAPRKQAGKKRQ